MRVCDDTVTTVCFVLESSTPPHHPLTVCNVQRRSASVRTRAVLQSRQLLVSTSTHQAADHAARPQMRLLEPGLPVGSALGRLACQPTPASEQSRRGELVRGRARLRGCS